MSKLYYSFRQIKKATNGQQLPENVNVLNQFKLTGNSTIYIEQTPELKAWVRKINSNNRINGDTTKLKDIIISDNTMSDSKKVKLLSKIISVDMANPRIKARRM
jgi:hypothetical protein